MAGCKVSVVVPCYNLGAYLEEALASVEKQTLRDLEVLVVDDGSDDPATRKLLDTLPAARARVLRQDHAGVCAARNRGLAAARGEYVCFFDGDDRMRPQCLQKACARLDADPGLAFVSFWVRLFDGEDWDWRPGSCDALALLEDCCVATAAVTRRSALLEAGGFDAASEAGHEDWDLWLTLVERGFCGEIIPEVLFDYRRRAGSRSTLADDPAMYLELLRQRFRKHEALHRAHLFELLVAKDRAARRMLAATEPIDKLQWTVTRRRAEIEQLQRTLFTLVENPPPPAGRRGLLRWLLGEGE